MDEEITPIIVEKKEPVIVTPSKKERSMPLYVKGEMRANAEKEILKHLEQVTTFIKENEVFFKEVQEYVFEAHPKNCVNSKNEKATYYFYLLEYYVHQFHVFKDNIYKGVFLVKLNRSVEEINHFISERLAPLVSNLYETRTENMKKIWEADIIGVLYPVMENLTNYEARAYEKLSYINRTIDILSTTSIEFMKTEMA